MSPRAGLVLGLGLIGCGLCCCDFFRRRRHGAHGL